MANQNQWYFQQGVNPYSGQCISPHQAVEAWKEGLLTEEEARRFFGLGPKVKPCEKCR